MSSTLGDTGRIQVLYLGGTTGVSTLRRTLEDHGAVTRTRLTPEVDAVVADPSVAPGHPTVVSAERLGIPVLSTEQAVGELAEWIARPQSRPAPAPAATAPRHAAASPSWVPSAAVVLPPAPPLPVAPPSRPALRVSGRARPARPAAPGTATVLAVLLVLLGLLGAVAGPEPAPRPVGVEQVAP